MADEQPPYWVLISVLFSSFPLTSRVATAVLQVAQELYVSGDGEAPVHGDFVSGKVKNLKKQFLVGTIGGPAFEAELETERGAGTVRFMLTREAIALAEAQSQRAKVAGGKQYLN